MCNVPAIPIPKERDSWISTERMLEIIDEMKEMGVAEFGVSGGEPLLDVERLFKVLEYAAKRGIYTHFGTNGLLMSEEILRRYDSMGVGHISLSFDAIGEVHDLIRGKAGTFEDGVLKAIEIFKKVNPKNINLKINAIFSNDNLEQLPELIEFVGKSKFMIFLQPFDPCAYDFFLKNRDAEAAHREFSQWIPPDRFELLDDVIEQTISIEKKYPGCLLNDIEHLRAIKRYFSLELLENPAPCTVAFEKLWIRANGDVKYCNYGHIGNLKDSSLREIWNCDRIRKTRKAMLNCKFVCLLGCIYSSSVFSIFKKGMRTARLLLK